LRDAGLLTFASFVAFHEEVLGFSKGRSNCNWPFLVLNIMQNTRLQLTCLFI
jgi:hypothetical protein